MRESRTFGSVRGGDGNIPTYSDGLLDFAFGSPCLVDGIKRGEMLPQRPI
jgi:hypothetical protein